MRRARTAAVASLLPGVGHLIVGRRRTGTAVLLATLALVIGLGIALMSLDARRTERLAVRQDTLLTVAVALVVAGLLWCATILSAYRAARPPRASRTQTVVSRGLVAGLCLAVMAPLTYGASTVYAARDVLHDTFRSDLAQATGDGAEIPGSPAATPAPTPAPTPFADKPRVNLLLLGGDADQDRKGLRTDTLVLASIDTVTGHTRLISLPRNLQNVPLRPGTPLARAYPGGFPDFWFSLYTAAEDTPALMPQVRPENAGAAAITDTVAYLTGVDIDYYAV
ncbi:MAG TPA: hypothetical protein VMZ00_17160, partial [Sporichthya sp.]|nr:hypothetical protein [Sporichthya sp.]